MKDSKRKSAIKIISWTTLVICMTSVVIYLLTGRIFESIGVGALIELIELIAYYYHGRIWVRYDENRKKFIRDFILVIAIIMSISLAVILITYFLYPVMDEIFSFIQKHLGYLFT